MLAMSTESPQSPRVLRIPRSDEQESYVLLQVSRSRSAALDLDIAATEGENPYTGFGVFLIFSLSLAKRCLLSLPLSIF